MVKMKKVEVIIEAVYINRLIDLLNTNGITKYTLMKDIEGFGGHGMRSADDAMDAFSNDYIFTVCEEEKFEAFKEELRAFINRYGGKCFVADCMMLL